MIWKIRKFDPAAARELSRELSCIEPVARVLAGRGYCRPDIARRFLEAGPADLHDPGALSGMDRAVERIGRALRRREKVFIFGDYDVDGVTSIAALAAMFSAARIPFEVHQPNRLREGYGLSEAAVDLARAAGCSLLITVDCGTEAQAPIRRAADAGIDVIVVDHHEQKGPLPPALAVLNPNREGCEYPFKELAAVGVVFKLLQAGEKVWKVPLPWERIWQLAAVGTVADMAPLVDENRVLVKVGIDFLRRNRDPAFRALLRAAGLDARKLSAGHLSFQIGPRLNAAGRLGTPETGRRLFQSQSLEEMEAAAAHLNTLNQRRQALQARIFEEAEKKIGEKPGKYLRTVIVVEGEGWSKGVVGIVASKLQEKYYRPAVVIALEEEMGVGSARGIPGFDLFAAISSCAPYLMKFGGHRHAAGLNILKSRIDDFRTALNRAAEEVLGEEDLVPRLTIDAELRLGEVGPGFLEELASFEPCGLANPAPLFISPGLSLRGKPRLIGKSGAHLKMWLAEGGACREAVGWGMANRAGELTDRPLDVVYQVKSSEYNPHHPVQLVLKDFRPSPSNSEFS